MTKKSEIIDGTSTPVQKIEDCLWQYGQANPDCRELIAKVVPILSTLAQEESMALVLPHDIDKRFGLLDHSVIRENMKRIRLEMGKTHADLGRSMGMTRSMIQQIESGRRHVNRDSLLSLAKALRISIYNLVEPQNSK